MSDGPSADGESDTHDEFAWEDDPDTPPEDESVPEPDQLLSPDDEATATESSRLSGNEPSSATESEDAAAASNGEVLTPDTGDAQETRSDDFFPDSDSDSNSDSDTQAPSTTGPEDTRSDTPTSDGHDPVTVEPSSDSNVAQSEQAPDEPTQDKSATSKEPTEAAAESSSPDTEQPDATPDEPSEPIQSLFGGDSETADEETADEETAGNAGKDGDTAQHPTSGSSAESPEHGEKLTEPPISGGDPSGKIQSARTVSVPLPQDADDITEWTVDPQGAIADARPNTATQGQFAEAIDGVSFPGATPADSGGPDTWSEYTASGDAADTEAVKKAVQSASVAADQFEAVIDDHTIDTVDDAGDSFFETAGGGQAVVSRYDLEQTVPDEMKPELTEFDRYWVNKPYAYISLLRSEDDNEVKYFVVEPHLLDVEDKLLEYLIQKIRESITRGGFSEDKGETSGETEAATTQRREQRVEEKAYELFRTFELYSEDASLIRRVYNGIRSLVPGMTPPQQEGDDGAPLSVNIRPKHLREEEQGDTLSRYQVKKLLYYLKRDFVGYEAIDPIKNDVNVEDISCNGYDSRVFVYHTEHEQIISNVSHGREELDEFVMKLAQRASKGISKRSPQVDATLEDGSRAQLTLGTEVSDKGTNYTIRQFKDVPFTPVDLINWQTFSLDQMGFLWLAIENNKNLIFAGGTASGKTTSLNAVSLFIPSNSKIVSIEDTREVELPQRNWISSVTRPSFSDDDGGDVDEFDLLEAALRQRPDYIVMGEIRGEEGRTAFQVMSTGHTTYTTFHADSVGEVLKRFTTDPINVSKTMFTALDLVSIQVQTRLDGNKVRRSRTITEINHYDAENDEINIRDIYQWNADTDSFRRTENADTLEQIAFDRGWSHEQLEQELTERKIVLAYLIVNGFKKYRKVAATIQAFIADKRTVMGLIAAGELDDRLEKLQKMETVSIDVDDASEELVPRPDPGDGVLEVAEDVLESNRDIIREYADEEAVTEGALKEALTESGPDGAEVTAAADAEPTEATEQLLDEAAAASTSSPLDEAATEDTSPNSPDLSEPSEDTPATERDRAITPAQPKSGSSAAETGPAEADGGEEAMTPPTLNREVIEPGGTGSENETTAASTDADAADTQGVDGEASSEGESQ